MNDLIKRLREIEIWGGEDAPDHAADRLTAMKAAGDGLAGFVRHKSICSGGLFMQQSCTCGLTAALKQWKEASDGL